ncbi:MAG TPA: M43 family zinc metalloprotease, partial [Chryseosolibacter sp.]
MTFRLLFLFNVFLLFSFCVGAQDRCGTVEYNNQLKKRGLVPVDDRVFEDWLKSRMSVLRSSSTKRLKGPPYKIPVVVHVIHKGEQVGVGSNISDAQILSQISVLNEDFRRMNPDAGNTPSQFLPVAGSLDIEFVLAKSDPEGLPTTGIVRVQGSKDGWVLADQYELKSQSYWPAEDYLNLWVCDMVDNLVGYGQYPESTLPGIDNSSANRLTDGVAVWYRAFGSIDDGNFDLSSTFNKGRTLTHELGHFLGLRHIWGDDSGACTGTDYVDDTPNQATASSGCPTHPRNSCGSVNMFQNFMDYTQDGCMNLFTKEQIARVTTVLENSPRRASLLTSPGLNEPLVVQRDIGIRHVISPKEFECSNTISPSIEIRNYGTATVTATTVQLTVNGIVTETRTFDNTLANLAVAQVSFSPVIVPTGVNTISFSITEVNGAADQNTANNSISNSFTVATRETTPFSENFNSFPSKWVLHNPDGKVTWEHATAPRETPQNKAMLLNFFDYEESYGEVDILLTPVLDLTDAPVASLVFDRSYVRYVSSNDRLKIVVLEDCEPIEDGTVVFDSAGSALRTANSVAGSFVPSGIQDWQREFINLTAFAGRANIQIAFIAISDWGNNLYLDNVSVITSELEDVSLLGIDSPSFITCESNPSPLVLGQNVGTKTITQVTIQY